MKILAAAWRTGRTPLIIRGSLFRRAEPALLQPMAFCEFSKAEGTVAFVGSKP